MAGNSSVVIYSSSPSSFQIPAETPQANKQRTTIAPITSSPDLPSPSTFFTRPTSPILHAGPQAQHVPQGATTGFASAARLLKSNYFDDRPAESPKSTEATEREPLVHCERRRSITPLPEVLCRDAKPGQEAAVGSPSLLQAPLQASERRRRSISLSANDFHPPREDATEVVPAVPKPAKKPRKSIVKATGAETAKPTKKRATRTKDQSGDAAPKKPRKRLEKSASIILNSDDLASTQFRTLDPETIGAGKHTDPTADEAKQKRAPAAKTRRAPKKAKPAEAKTTSKRSAHPDVMPDQSTYFDAAPPPNGAVAESPTLDSFGSAAAATSVDDPPTPVHACRRRLSWTPAKNTTAPELERSNTAMSTESIEQQPTLSLAALVGNLVYAKQDNSVCSQRSVSGEALTKRRRIELADEATRAPAAPRAVELPPAEPKKKEKAPKKKPQTITALATKAYEVAEEPAPNAGPAEVSAFFAAEMSHTSKENAAAASVPKPKRTRKPRSKKDDDDKATPKANKAPKTVKAAKTKVRFNEADYLPPLYTPSQARVEEKRQGFLFGTSSQLAVEDSPSFIRQMQLAMDESKMFSESAASPAMQSCAKVPLAPHGMELSLRQADRGLWCVAARDDGNDMFHAAYKKRLSPQKLVSPQRKLVDARREHVAPELETIDSAGAASVIALPDRIPSPPPAVDPGSEIINLCHTSPVAEAEDVPKESASEPLTDGVTKPDAAISNIAPAPPSDDEWMMLGSGEAIPDAGCNLHVPAQITGPLFKAVNPSLKRSQTSPRRSALQALDSNTHLLAHTLSQKAPISSQQRAFTTTARAEEQKRPRGRPKKDAPIDATCSPKRRERPPKQKAALMSPKSFKPITSASQPTSSEYVNVDDIDDPDAHVTPSPPHRRANSSPPAVQPLDFAITASPSKKSKPPAAAATSKLKPDDPIWLTMMPDVFSRIAATVRSTPPSTDMANPTWHEKILLYDPIVLEDLTAWLNEKEVWIQTQRLKARPKTKGRKKKGVGVEEEELEYEMVTEELKPWMVQRWCEKTSICCLWREGLRGGVRTRY